MDLRDFEVYRDLLDRVLRSRKYKSFSDVMARLYKINLSKKNKLTGKMGLGLL